MTRKIKPDTPGPIPNVADKSSKLLKSQSDDPSRSRKRKASELSSSSPKAPKSTLDHVKRFLAEASERELDRLAECLNNRKKPRSLKQQAGEARTSLKTQEKQ